MLMSRIIENNFKWNIEKLQNKMLLEIRAVQEDARTPYGFLMHPETYHSIITSEEYGVYHRPYFDFNKLFGMKIVFDTDCHLGEYDLSVKEK